MLSGISVPVKQTTTATKKKMELFTDVHINISSDFREEYFPIL